MSIERITSLTHPGVEVFSALTEAQLRNTLQPEKGMFIAESPKVIRVALDAGYQPLSLLCEERHIVGDAADIIARCGDIPVYTGERGLLAQLTGYTLPVVCFVPCAVSQSQVLQRCVLVRRECVLLMAFLILQILELYSVRRLHWALMPLFWHKMRATPLIVVPCACLWGRCFLFHGRGLNNL